MADKTTVPGTIYAFIRNTVFFPKTRLLARRWVGAGICCISSSVLTSTFIQPFWVGLSVSCLLGFAGLILATIGVAGMFLGGNTKNAADVFDDDGPSYSFLRGEDRSISYEGYETYVITMPKDTTWQPQRAWKAMDILLENFAGGIFQIDADHHFIRWRLINIGLDYAPDQIKNIIRSVYPEAEVRVLPYTIAPQAPFFRCLAFFGSQSLFIPPLPYVTDFRGFDPLATVVQTMDTLQPGEHLSYNITVGGLVPPRPFWIGALSETTHQKDMPEIRNLYEEKRRSLSMDTMITVQIDSPHKQRVDDLLRLIASPLTRQFRRGYPNNELVLKLTYPAPRVISPMIDFDTSFVGFLEKRLQNPDAGPKIAVGTELNALELAALWHPPHKDMGARHIDWGEPVKGEVPSELVGMNDGVCFGVGIYEENPEYVYHRDIDRRLHMSVLGAAGAGKSTFLHNVIHQDIAQGKGVAVVDPHGSLVTAILQQSIPSDREKDVVVLDFAQTDFPAPLNPFRVSGKQGSSGSVLRTISQVYDTSSYARMSRFISAAIQTAEADPEATMRDVSRVFREEEYRFGLLDQLDNPVLDETWDDFEQYSPSQQRMTRDPIVSRVTPFYDKKQLYHIFCHPDGIDFAEHMRQKRIILISMSADSRSLSDEEQSMIGMLLISQLQLAGMELTIDYTRPPFYITIDEVERFASSALDTILNESRKFGLSLTLAHQYLYQIKWQLLKSVMTNVATRVVFRSSREDGQEFVPYMGDQFDTDDIVNLPNHQALIKLQHTPLGEKSPILLPGFSVHTMDPIPTPDDAEEREARIRALSISRWTPKSCEEVKAWLERRYPRRRGPGPGTDGADPSRPRGPRPDDGDNEEPDDTSEFYE